MLSRIPIVLNPVYLRRFGGGLWLFVAAILVANHHKSPMKCRKYAEFGTMCIRVPVKSMPCLLCVMYMVSGRYMTVSGV